MLNTTVVLRVVSYAGLTQEWNKRFQVNNVTPKKLEREQSSELVRKISSRKEG